MSVVTNLVLSLSIFDAHGADRYHEEGGPKIAEINRFFEPVQGLTDIDTLKLPRGWYGGSKMLEAHLYVGAFNHIDLRSFITHLRSIKWERPECVQLFVKEEDDERFRLINVMEDMPLIGPPRAES
jgi:hypothetical protein